MAKKSRTVKDPATEAMLSELFRNIDFGNVAGNTKAGNFNGVYVAKTDTGNKDVEFSISHTLDRTPVGFITVRNNKGGVVYESGTAWTSTTIYFKYSTANNASVIILIW